MISFQIELIGENNALRQVKDTPTNNFATWNTLTHRHHSTKGILKVSFSEGNLKGHWSS